MTAVRSKAGRLLFNANTGQHFFESTEPLAPLDVEIDESIRYVKLVGHQLSVKQRFEAIDELTEFVQSVYYALPLLLAVEFADPPLVERVDGRIGNATFRWELSDWTFAIETTDQERQEARFAEAWDRMDLVAPPERRRLLGALYYFTVACRLRREAKSPGEFLAESLHNFAKVLEVLYGPDREHVRKELAVAGVSTEEIERDFIPAMLLRNSIDVGHPMLALFTSSELQVLHRYADRAEQVFRSLLRRLLDGVQQQTIRLADYQVGRVDAETQMTIQRLKEHLDALGNRP